MLSELLSGERGNIVSMIASKLGVGNDQAGGFFDKAIDMIQGLVSGGKLDIGDLVGGNLSAITSKVNLSELGATLGGGPEKAEEGLGVLLDGAKDKLGGDAEGLLGKLGGAGDALKGLGKMFG